MRAIGERHKLCVCVRFVISAQSNKQFQINIGHRAISHDHDIGEREKKMRLSQTLIISSNVGCSLRVQAKEETHTHAGVQITYEPNERVHVFAAQVGDLTILGALCKTSTGCRFSSNAKCTRHTLAQLFPTLEILYNSPPFVSSSSQPCVHRSFVCVSNIRYIRVSIQFV